MIFKIQPYTVDKSQFGVEYNLHCSVVPKGEWILLLDWDAMILSRESYALMQKAIDRYPDTAVFGAMTNRISYSHQRLGVEMDGNDSIRNHIKIATEQAMKYSDGESVEAPAIAGFFMLFNRTYWEQIGGFQEKIMDDRGRLFDENFSVKAWNIGKKCRVIKGIYCFHQYRLMSENYKNKDHLKDE